MYVLLGSHGHITSRAARALLQHGSPVRVVGRSGLPCWGGRGTPFIA